MKIIIIDYGAGNVQSVFNAIKEIYNIYDKRGMEYRDVFEKIIKKSNYVTYS